VTESADRYEMLWDCSHCGTDALLALSQRFCPTCGSPQDPTQRYFPSDEEKVAVEDHPLMGADKVCRACDTPNAAAATYCVGCGADLADARGIEARSDVVVGVGEAFQGESAADAKAEARARMDAARAAAMGKTPAAPPKAGMGWLGWSILLAVGGGIVALILFFTWTREVGVTVQSLAWERTIVVEAFGEVSDSAWCDELPAGAKGVRRSKEKKGTKQVPDGETCVMRKKDLGDGTFKEVKECTPKTKEEPVMADMCRFTIDKWSEARTEKASGGGKEPAPEWPKVTLAKTGECRGCEREGAKQERYIITFARDGGTTQECDVDRARWDAAAPGQAWKGAARMMGGALACDTLKP
jgi:hypothetical protein